MHVSSATKPGRQEYRVYNRHADNAELVAVSVVLVVWLVILTLIVVL